MIIDERPRMIDKYPDLDVKLKDGRLPGNWLGVGHRKGTGMDRRCQMKALM